MEFTTKRGWLTYYSLACGYLETNKPNHDESVRVTLGHTGGVGFDVKVSTNQGGLVYWETTETLPQARKLFTEQCKLYNVTRKMNKEPA